MLNKEKLLQQIQNVEDQLFLDTSQEVNLAKQVWQKIVQDPHLQQKIQAANAPWLTPSWPEQIDKVVAIEPQNKPYTAISVDGSQIYPDRHQQAACFLINTGTVIVRYNTKHQRKVLLDSDPYLFTGNSNELEIPELSTDMVNCKRQEYEFVMGLEAMRMEQETDPNTEKLLLFDGSLIFWHLQSKDPMLKQLFLQKYIASLHASYQEKLLLAGYISLPKSKELVNVIRVALCDFIIEGCTEYKQVDHLVDSTIARFFLQPNTRTIVFKSNATVCGVYPEQLRPYFFYIHIGQEIARVEIPAWIAQDEYKTNAVARIMLDQANKGQGYPITIAEAHEQAVVKGADREFFYHLINKIGISKKRRLTSSVKSMRKKRIGV